VTSTANPRENFVPQEESSATDGASAADRIDREIGQRLRGARTLRGLSQSEVAAKVGLSFQQIQKYEAGHSRVTAAKLNELAEVFALPVGFFFGECGTEGGGGESSSGPISQEAWSLAGEFEQIRNPKTRQKVLDLVRTLAEE
jgi:transcriptional regulator with XRE-family HTH domain